MYKTNAGYNGPVTLESGEVIRWWDDASYAAYQAWDPVDDREPGESAEWLDMMGAVALHLENGLPPWIAKPAELAALTFLDPNHVAF